jgi:hypothetical protein
MKCGDEHINVTVVTLWKRTSILEMKQISREGKDIRESSSAALGKDSLGKIHNDFVCRANQVFATNSPNHRQKLAESEALMLWLVWRGSDEYIIRHSGNVEAMESSWRICPYREVANILEHARSKEEFRPVAEEFSQASLASIIQQIHKFTLKKGTLNIGPNNSAIEVFAEKISQSPIERKDTEILSAMTLVEQGWTLVVRWPIKDNKLLFARIIELSSNRLLFQNYTSLDSDASVQNPSLVATRGYIKFAKHKDRLEQQRKRRLGIVRWLSTQRE